MRQSCASELPRALVCVRAGLWGQEELGLFVSPAAAMDLGWLEASSSSFQPAVKVVIFQLVQWPRVEQQDNLSLGLSFLILTWPLESFPVLNCYY